MTRYATDEDPVTRPDTSPMGGTVTTHPAFAQIAAARVSGGGVFYGSDFVPQGHIAITLKRSELHRRLNYDSYFSGRVEEFRIAMTEAQWATFVSSLNVGEGVPCTLERLQGREVPTIPRPKPRADQFREEVRETAAEMAAEISGAIAEVEAMGIPKGKAAAIISRLNRVRKGLESTMPFIAAQFEEHMEVVTEDAKAEVFGHMQRTYQHAAQLGSSAPVPQIDGNQAPAEPSEGRSG